MKRILFLLSCGWIMAGCNNKPIFPVTPFLTYISISPMTVREYRDSIAIQFEFQDGDGDLGDKEGGESFSLRVADNRSFFPDSLRTLKFKLPDLKPTTKNPSITGTITLWYPATILTPGVTKDSTTYTIYVLDAAGHKSNEITTEQIYILP